MNKTPLYIEFYDDYIAEDNSYTWIRGLKYRIIRKDDNFYYIVQTQGIVHPIPKELEGKIYITGMIQGG